MEYKVGDVLATHMPTLLSKIICWVTKSRYSHLALIVSETELIESDGIAGNIRYRPISDFKGYADVYTYNSLTDKLRQDILEYAISRLGQKYDYKLLLFYL